MLDKILIKHLDKMDLIADDIDNIINKVMGMIDIELVIENPQEAMLGISDVVQEMLKEEIIEKSLQNGEDLAIEIESLKRGDKIELPNKEDSTVNKELDDKR